jgi:hypothetical protein
MRSSAQSDVRSCRSCGRAIHRFEPFPLEQALMDHCYRCTQAGATCRCISCRCGFVIYGGIDTVERSMKRHVALVHPVVR